MYLDKKLKFQTISDQITPGNQHKDHSTSKVTSLRGGIGKKDGKVFHRVEYKLKK